MPTKTRARIYTERFANYESERQRASPKKEPFLATHLFIRNRVQRPSSARAVPIESGTAPKNLGLRSKHYYEARGL